MKTTAPAPSSPPPRWPWWLCGLLSLLPLVLNHRSFAALFYFQDEWDLLDVWSKQGFARWAGTVFAENFMPLFKTIWGGSIIAFHGNYFALLSLEWLNHVVNAALVVRLAQRLGCSPLIALLGGLLFGLSPLNHETLGWSLQWSAVLSLTFFLVGALTLLPAAAEPAGPLSGKRITLGMLCALASALCFSRGILTGPALSVLVLTLGRRHGPWGRQLFQAALLAIPAFAVGLVVADFSSGNHHHLSDAWRPAAMFALHYFGESPLRTSFTDVSASTAVASLLVALRLMLSALAWRFAPQSAKPLVLALVAFELGNAVLLGLGRYHTGIPAAGSSRYQYTALCCLAPILVVLLQRVADRFRRRVRFAVVGTASVALVCYCLGTWTPVMKNWRTWRGDGLRAALAQPDFPAKDHFTQLPWMTNERARELVAEYHLN